MRYILWGSFWRWQHSVGRIYKHFAFFEKILYHMGITLYYFLNINDKIPKILLQSSSNAIRFQRNDIHMPFICSCFSPVLCAMRSLEKSSSAISIFLFLLFCCHPNQSIWTCQLFPLLSTNFWVWLCCCPLMIINFVLLILIFSPNTFSILSTSLRSSCKHSVYCL